MPKVHSLFTVKKDVNAEIVSKSTKIKNTEKNIIKNKTVQNNTRLDKTNTVLANKTKTTSTNTNENITTTKWVKSTDMLPQELRPILFNVKADKHIHGYRHKINGYILKDVYNVNLFKQEHGYIEWKYVDGCINLDSCPNGFPDCSNCKLSKK